MIHDEIAEIPDEMTQANTNSTKHMPCANARESARKARKKSRTKVELAQLPPIDTEKLWLAREDIARKLGCSISTVKGRSNPKSSQYDPDFPQARRMKGMVVFWHKEVTAFAEAVTLKNTNPTNELVH